MSEIVLQAATFLEVTPMDVYLLAGGLVFVIAFLVMWVQKTYEVFFGLVVGLAIYLMLSVLLSSQYQTVDTIKFFSPGFSNFLIGSSAYLIFILMILTPISGGIKVPHPKHIALKILAHLWLAIALIVFITALILGFAMKTYIFGVDTGFTLLAKTELYHELLATKIIGWVALHLQPVVLFGVMFMLYKLLFAEMLGTLMSALIVWLKSLKDKNASSGGDAHAEHDDHGGHDDHGWHDEHGMDDFELDDVHDDHSHGHGAHGHH